MDNELISVTIPAFNQPDYLKTLLRSLFSQSYRPIELIISDDCSPRTLEPVVAKAMSSCPDGIRILFFRQQRNLGVMGNFRFCVDHCSGKYLVPFSHDIRITDRDYLRDAVGVMRTNPGCCLSIANCTYEGTQRKMLTIDDGAYSGWEIMNGCDFIKRYRRGGINWSQAMVLDHEIASSLKAYDEPFMVGPRLSHELRIAQDNLCAFVFLLSAVGSVAVTRQCVCEVGMPADSYSRSKTWQNSKKKVKFLILYNISQSDLQGRHSAAVRKCAYRQAREYVDYIRDLKLAAYYGWDVRFMLLLVLSFLKMPWFQVRQFVKGVKRLTGKTGTIKKKEFSGMSKSKAHMQRSRGEN